MSCLTDDWFTSVLTLIPKGELVSRAHMTRSFGIYISRVVCVYVYVFGFYIARVRTTSILMLFWLKPSVLETVQQSDSPAFPSFRYITHTYKDSTTAYPNH